jgi:lipopolysaccharide/colanic/teichoic acid biosynthesis glycosyltransferase
MFSNLISRNCYASSLWDLDAAAGPWRSARYSERKRLPELLLTAMLFLLVAPVMLVIMAFVRLTSRGPALYAQVRVGLNGRLFTIYKIRTMTLDCERLSGPCWSTSDDPRVTRFGRFLRRSHLDELPQLWNILIGDMSLVGPRPERPEFVNILERTIPSYRDRLVIRPGLTGLAQVQLAPDTDLGDVHDKLTFDLHYIRDCNLWLDLRLLACTALFLMGIPFRLSSRLLRIPDREDVEGAGRSGESHTEVGGVPARARLTADRVFRIPFMPAPEGSTLRRIDGPTGYGGRSVSVE